jgi:outer membrane lipoprotein-sorting protein
MTARLLLVTLAVTVVLCIQAGTAVASARAGTRLGEVLAKMDGKKVGETSLVAKKGYEEASLGQRVWYTVGGIFD